MYTPRALKRQFTTTWVLQLGFLCRIYVPVSRLLTRHCFPPLARLSSCGGCWSLAGLTPLKYATSAEMPTGAAQLANKKTLNHFQLVVWRYIFFSMLNWFPARILLKSGGIRAKRLQKCIWKIHIHFLLPNCKLQMVSESRLNIKPGFYMEGGDRDWAACWMVFGRGLHLGLQTLGEEVTPVAKKINDPAGPVQRTFWRHLHMSTKTFRFRSTAMLQNISNF